MLLIVVRHAHAEPAGPADPDELRPLSAAGREQARDLGDRLAALRPARVVSSPLLRARETAAAIAKATGLELRVADGLAPGAGIDEVLAAAEGANGPVVTVGHQPDCSLIVEALGGGEVDFPPAWHVTVEL